MTVWVKLRCIGKVYVGDVEKVINLAVNSVFNSVAIVEIVYRKGVRGSLPILVVALRPFPTLFHSILSLLVCQPDGHICTLFYGTAHQSFSPSGELQFKPCRFHGVYIALLYIYIYRETLWTHLSVPLCLQFQFIFLQNATLPPQRLWVIGCILESFLYQKM